MQDSQYFNLDIRNAVEDQILACCEAPDPRRQLIAFPACFRMLAEDLRSLIEPVEHRISPVYVVPCKVEPDLKQIGFSLSGATDGNHLTLLLCGQPPPPFGFDIFNAGV